MYELLQCQKVVTMTIVPRIVAAFPTSTVLQEQVESGLTIEA